MASQPSVRIDPLATTRPPHPVFCPPERVQKGQGTGIHANGLPPAPLQCLTLLPTRMPALSQIVYDLYLLAGPWYLAEMLTPGYPWAMMFHYGVLLRMPPGAPPLPGGHGSWRFNDTSERGGRGGVWLSMGACLPESEILCRHQSARVGGSRAFIGCLACTVFC